MANNAVGYIETYGLTSCVVAADAAVKTGNVELLGYEYAKGGGLCTVKVRGNVGAVKAAIKAGKRAAEAVKGSHSGTKSVLLMPRPSDQIKDVLIDNANNVGGEIALRTGIRPKGESRMPVLVSHWKPKEDKASAKAPETPVVEDLKEENVVEEPKAEKPEAVEEAPKAEPVVEEHPKPEAPKAEEPVKEEAPKVEPIVEETPKPEAPKAEEPVKEEAPKAEEPVEEEASKTVEPAKAEETVKEEAPKAEKPVETTPVESPKAEEPAEESAPKTARTPRKTTSTGKRRSSRRKNSDKPKK
ncbi:MAG: BMC domain-containing protein [Lachnospiraceae bacterium]|nr:BMC domain-containing protein [Lachnospiraceae bacterium]